MSARLLRPFGFVGSNAPLSYPCSFPVSTPVTKSILESAPASAIAHAVRFDGTNDYYEIAAPGPATVADGTGFTWARWIKMEGGDGALQTLLWIGTGANYGLKIERLASNLIQAQWRTAAGVVIGTVVSTTAVTVASGWVHLMLDISATAAVLRVDFAQENNNTPGTAGDIDLTEKWTIARSDDSLNRNYFNGCMAEEWAADASLGLASDDTAEQFYDSTLGRPRILGTAGAGPSANVLVYLNNAFASFHINKAGTDFTLTGAVDDCAGPGNYSAQHVPTAQITNPVFFDGVNDALASTVQPPADSLNGLGSFWFKRNSASGVTERIIHGQSGRFQIYFDSGTHANKITLGFFDAGGGRNTFLRSSAILDTIWHHCMWSIKVQGTGTSLVHLLIDGVSDLTVAADGLNNFAIEWTRPYRIGSEQNVLANLLHGDLAQFYLNTAEYMDLSIASNALKFYNAGPVDLGSDGSTPTGTAPEIFMKDPAATIINNSGAGADWTEIGVIEESLTSPG